MPLSSEDTCIHGYNAPTPELKINLVKNDNREAGKMAQLLRLQTAFAEGQSSTPRSWIRELTTACNCRGSDASSSSGNCTHMHIHIDTHI